MDKKISLFPIYGKSVLKAGKVLYPEGNPKRETHAKSNRYKWKENMEFKLLPNHKNRIKVAYFNTEMDPNLRSKLSFFENLYNSQGE